MTTVQNTNDSVELVVTSVKVEGKPYSKFMFEVFVDDTQIGQVSNGGTSTYKITPGQHCVTIGRCSIGIDIPKGNAPVTLNWQWGIGASVKPEIICEQAHLVTKPFEIVKMTAQNKIGFAGLACVVLGFIGIILGFMFSSSSSGSYVSAEEHLLISAVMDFALYFIIGGFALVAIGVIIGQISSRKKKK